MIEKNLKTRNKFINKLHIKIEDLNNNVSLLSKLDKKIFKNIINQKGGTNIIQSINIRDMFINKLFIKIEDLKNNFTLLSKVDKTIFKNIINQKGGTSIIDNINDAFLYVVKMKNNISTYNNDILKLTEIDKDLNEKVKNISTFLNILVNYFGNPYKKSNRYNEIDKDDLVILNQLMETRNVSEFLGNPENKIFIDKIGIDLLNKFFQDSDKTEAISQSTSPSISRVTSTTTTPSISPLTTPRTPSISRVTTPSISPLTSTTSTPRTILNAPTNVIAIAGDMEATVRWTPPADNGGSEIISYTVTSNPENKIEIVNGSTTTAIVSGLTNDTDYTFTVLATNAAKNLSPSIASMPITPKAKYPIEINNGMIITTKIIHYPQVKNTDIVKKRNYDFLHYIYKKNPDFYNEYFYKEYIKNSKKKPQQTLKELLRTDSNYRKNNELKQKLLLSINYTFYKEYYNTLDSENIITELENDNLIKLLNSIFMFIFNKYIELYVKLYQEYTKTPINMAKLTGAYKLYIIFKYNYLYLDDTNLINEIMKIKKAEAKAKADALTPADPVAVAKADTTKALPISYNQDFFKILKKEILNQMSYRRDIIIEETNLNKIKYNSPFILPQYIKKYTDQEKLIGQINKSFISSHLSLTDDELSFYNKKIFHFL
jgi:hypothetical protein